MFLQLGNMVLQGVNTPESWSVSGDDANYAEHALINSKSRLQKTGDALEEHSISIRLRAEYCNPRSILDELKKSKAAGDVLPLLLGNGIYMGDFVIISNPYEIQAAFPDGTPYDISVTLTLREFVSFSKKEIQEQQARHAAFAVGIKKTIQMRPAQPNMDYARPSVAITQAMENTNKINSLSTQYNDNVSKREKLASDIKATAAKAKTALDDAQYKIQQSEKIMAKATGVVAAAERTKDMLVGVVSVLPPTNLSDLSDANNYLQSSVSALNTASTNLFIPVAIRRENNVKV